MWERWWKWDAKRWNGGEDTEVQMMFRELRISILLVDKRCKMMVVKNAHGTPLMKSGRKFDLIFLILCNYYGLTNDFILPYCVERVQEDNHSCLGEPCSHWCRKCTQEHRKLQRKALLMGNQALGKPMKSKQKCIHHKMARHSGLKVIC